MRWPVLSDCIEAAVIGLFLMALPSLIWWGLWILYQFWHFVGVI